MDAWFTLLLPYALILARVGAFFGVLPIFSSASVPMIVRAGLAVLMTIFFSVAHPPGLALAYSSNWIGAATLMLQEAATGLALGLAIRFAYTAVQQAGFIMAQQMGFTDAETIDPETGEETQAIAMLFEMAFAVFFLVSSGHHLLLRLMWKSFSLFPVASTPDTSLLAQGLVQAGSTMLLFALKLAAPMLGAFVILAIVLAILARILPEMNILMESFPLRVALGLFMAAALMPSLSGFTVELAEWMSKSLMG